MPSADACLNVIVKRAKARAYGNVDGEIARWMATRRMMEQPPKHRCRCCPPDWLQGWESRHPNVVDDLVAKRQNATGQWQNEAGQGQKTGWGSSSSSSVATPPWRVSDEKSIGEKGVGSKSSSSSLSSERQLTFLNADVQQYCWAFKAFLENRESRPVMHSSWTTDDQRVVNDILSRFMYHWGVDDSEL